MLPNDPSQSTSPAGSDVAPPAPPTPTTEPVAAPPVTSSSGPVAPSSVTPGTGEQAGSGDSPPPTAAASEVLHEQVDAVKDALHGDGQKLDAVADKVADKIASGFRSIFGSKPK